MYYLTGGTVKVPMVIRLPYGVNTSGGYMTGAGPHHSQSPEAWFCHCAGLKVVMPTTASDALGLMKSAIRDNNPVVFCEQKGLYATAEELPEGEHLVPLGKAAVRRQGSDATVVATGATVGMALAVADSLAAQGLSIEVIDPRTLVPLDTGTILNSVRKTGRAVITQEAAQTMGFCTEIAAVIAEGAFAVLKAPVRRVAALDMPIPAGAAARGMLPTEERIEQAVRSTLQ
jgi:pyruvate dehydrogenase E1 component beta subunit